MHIGVAGPVSLNLLSEHLPAGTPLSRGYPFPLIAKYVNGLLARGHRVTVFTLCPETPAPRFFQGNFLSVSITPQRPRRWWLDLQQKEIRGLRDAMVAHPVEVMHAHWTYEFPRAAHWAGVPTLVTAHDSPLRILWMSMHTSGRWIRLSRHTHALRVLREARAVTAVSPYIEKELRRDFALACPLTVIPNGLDEGEIICSPRAKRDSTHIPVILSAFSGRFSGLKNGPLLLEACQRLVVLGRPFRLMLLGAGCEPGGEAQHFLHAQGWDLPVTFLGHQCHGDVLRIMRDEADLFVHPSLEESFGMAVLEAMSQGLPVVGGASSGAVPWLLGGGEVGFLADMRNPDSLAQAVLKALDSPDTLQLMSSAALHRARQQFNLDSVIDAYEGLLIGLHRERD